VLRCVPLLSLLSVPLSVGVLWSCRCSGSCSRVFYNYTDAFLLLF